MRLLLPLAITAAIATPAAAEPLRVQLSLADVGIGVYEVDKTGTASLLTSGASLQVGYFGARWEFAHGGLAGEPQLRVHSIEGALHVPLVQRGDWLSLDASIYGGASFWGAREVDWSFAPESVDTGVRVGYGLKLLMGPFAISAGATQTRFDRAAAVDRNKPLRLTQLTVNLAIGALPLIYWIK